MYYAVCNVPVSPLRREPSHKAEMVSQQLFGECCFALESFHNDWVRVKCAFDDYEGWCQPSQLIKVNAEYSKCKHNMLAEEWVNKISYRNDKMFIPMGSNVSNLKNLPKELTVKYSGQEWKTEKKKISKKNINEIACRFLNTPYLWGGKSVFGIDCSGLAQSVYKFFDIKLPRDAWQQAGEGEPVLSLKDAAYGDLAFFNNDEDKITHTGILFDDNRIIHSSGKVRIDKIDDDGIINIESNERTHRLTIIRRYFGGNMNMKYDV